MADTHLEKWLTILCEAKGSDLHVKAGSPPRMRLNGELRKIPDQPIISPEDAEDIARSVMAPSVAETFERNREADCAYAVQGLGRFRVNVFRQRGSVALVFRSVVDDVPSVEDLGLPPMVARLASELRGLVLVTGPTGSGKTTTLAAMVDHINRNRECHIVTIEDPIEVLHTDAMAAIAQREIGFDTKDFASAVRSAMRQDPDVILVGEMRDLDTVGAALAAAETGHLVLSTLHTVDAKETITRIVDFFPPHQHKQVRIALAGCLKGTVGQRLVPGIDGTYRVAALELMLVNGRIQGAIIDPEHSPEITELISEGEYYGMQTFDQGLAKLFEQGRIDLRSALVAASNPHDLRLKLQQRGLVTASSSQ